MKYFWIPILILTSLISLSLLNHRCISLYTQELTIQLEEVQQLTSENAWQEAESKLDQIYLSWGSRQAYFHIVCRHEELNNAEDLFQKSMALCHDSDEAELHSNVAELISQLHLLADMEAFSIQNIL